MSLVKAHRSRNLHVMDIEAMPSVVPEMIADHIADLEMTFDLAMTLVDCIGSLAVVSFEGL